MTPRDQILEAFSTACIELYFQPNNEYWRGMHDALRAVLSGQHPAPPRWRAPVPLELQEEASHGI